VSSGYSTFLDICRMIRNPLGLLCEVLTVGSAHGLQFNGNSVSSANLRTVNEQGFNTSGPFPRQSISLDEF